MEQGKKVMLQATVRDITERKRVEEVQTLLASIVQSSDDAIISGSLDGILLTWNQGAERVYGYAASEVIGKSAAILVPPDRLENFQEVLEKVRRGEYISHHETVRRTKDGCLIDVSLSLSPMRDASGILIGISTITRDITERKRTAEALRASQQIIEEIINAMPVRVFWKDKNLVFLGCNAVFARDAGFADPKDVIGKDDYQIEWRDQAEKYRADDRQVIESGCPKLLIEESQTTPEGNTITILTSKIPLRSSKGEISGLLGTYMDITERKRFEAQLVQSQKMEIVGKLAGGIAHEFNSIMTAIIGHSELLLIDLPPESPMCRNARQIRQSADRAAVLTRQLLAFGRKQTLRPEILDLNSILAGMENVLRHLAGNNGEICITPGAGLKAVKADAGQIEQVIVNIAMNAAEAMPHGGKLTLETANVTLDEAYVSHFPELKAAEYVTLAITDTGVGMSETVRTRVFEPFFSTKAVGQGTGLGLATCYGIIKQSGGHISVYSEPARGSTFKIYLPQVDVPAIIPVKRIDTPDLPRGTETILLVEDDSALREMAAMLLRRLGYTVLVAANGIEALTLIHQRDTGHIDLLFTDVIMPHMSGKELADRVQASYPHTRILFTSAYTGNAIVHQGVLDKGVALLQKPFTPSALAHKLREVLDQPIAPPPDPAQKSFLFANALYG
jgi:PAS domain S-box-containing protein